MLVVAVILMLHHPSLVFVNLARRIVRLEEYVDRNTIMVVTNDRPPI
jgi:hypothetical protein